MADVAQMFMEIPPVTRTYITLFSIINIGVQLNYLTPYQLYFNYQSIMKGEVWRLATNFFYVGPIGLRFFFHLLFLYRHARYLEEGSFRGRTADFVLFVIFSIGLLLVAALFIHVPFLADALGQVFVYVWARRNPYLPMAFFGLINFQAPYLPYVITAFQFAMGGHIINDILGIACGHVYYYLEDVFPNVEGGFKILVTPRFMKQLFDAREGANAQVNAEREAGNGPGGFDWGDNE